VWTNFDALYLDLSVLPRLKSPLHPQADHPSSPVMAADAVTIRASSLAADSTAALPRRIGSPGDERENGLRTCETPPAPLKKRPRYRGSADGATRPPPDPEELSELVQKAQRLVRGVNERQVLSALASSNYNFSRALFALRSWSSAQARRGADGVNGSSHAIGPPPANANSHLRRPLQPIPGSSPGSLDLHNCNVATSSDASESLDAGELAGVDNGSRKLQSTLTARAPVPTLHLSDVARGSGDTCLLDDLRDGSETEWDYGPNGDIMPPTPWWV
jgi:hypothetical protein